MRRKIISITAGTLGGLSLMVAGQLPAQTVTRIACGGSYSLFVKSDGSLWGMGYNGDGELGLGTVLSQTNVPVEIVTNGVGMVAAGGHSLFQQGYGLWAMGDNEFGELGDGTTNNRYVPEQVVLLGGTLTSHNYFSALAVGAYHSLFATANTRVVGSSISAMGWNGNGQLGDGTTNNHTSPEKVLSQLTGGAISSVAGGYDHSLYVLPDGSLWGMGDNFFGELGIGSTSTGTDTPAMIVSAGVVAVAAGAADSFFIKSDGSLWAMGDNFYGELGDGTNGSENDRYSPEQVLTGVIAVTAGEGHTLCIRSDGTLWGTGFNAEGQLGDGTMNDHDAWFPVGVSNVVAIAAGGHHSLFIKSDGSLWGMGDNEYGNLGTGNYYMEYDVPVEIVPPPQPAITGITVAGPNLVVTWPTNQGGFALQTTTNLGLSAAWSAVSPGPVIVNGQYTVTNPISASQQFFRLSE